jgi:hypothetical protein
MMKRAGVFLAGVWIAGGACAGGPVTTLSLLREMTDREAVARFPDPAYTSRQFGSYDRGTVAPDQPGWFANDDRSKFLRVETNGVRRECVMLDATGPGAIVRFWVTVAGTDGTGILRIYLDGSGTPEIEGKVLDVLSGGQLCGEPLSSSVSIKTEYLKRGHNLYLPIPYAKRCVITYESETVFKNENFYYNVECRTYDNGTEVKTFSLAELRSEGVAVSELRRTLAGCGLGLEGLKTQSVALDGVIAPGQSATCKVEGSRAVRLLSMALNNGRDSQALRSTVIELTFDGERTVWVPAGDFFGTGYTLSPYRMWHTQVSGGGLMEAAWVMPFAKSCELTLHNLGTNAVTVSQGVLVTAPWPWDLRSMHFGAGWTELNRVSTRTPANDHYDVNYVTLQGEGVLVGTGVTLFNTAKTWWGEGDEKVFVDGASFPTHIGTGSEDYYCYAWGNGNFFDHPFIAQPEGVGAGSYGLVVNLRNRALDAIPFRKRLQFDMEMWHWAQTVVNYAPVTCWYMKPGGVSNRGPEPKLAALPVALTRRDIMPLALCKEGAVEGEALESDVSRGSAKPQDGHPGAGWSGGKQLWWTGAKPGDTLRLTFGIAEAGRYALTLALTHANDYGIADIGLNGQTLLKGYDAFADKVETHVADAGVVELQQGENVLTFKITGENPKAKHDSYMQGVDKIEIRKVGAGAK